MNLEKRRAIFLTLKEYIPNAKTELNYSTPFQLLIAVILSAQATDTSVNKVTKKLFPIAGSAKELSKLSIEEIKTYVKTIGLYKNKAKNISLTSKIIEKNYAGKVPHDRSALESLPGVGRKTANVILNTIFGDPVIAVDTHIFRLANRTNLAPGKNPLEVEKRLTKLIPKDFLVDAHHLLILHGRYVCKAQKPVCNKCVIFEHCEYKGKS
jgi:endonuclease-3